MIQISTIKHFLKIFRILLPVLNILILLPAAYTQDTYTLTLSDTTTFDNDGCGKITAATWTVKDDSCVLYTPYFRKETEGITIVSYNFRVNQNGAGEFNDIAYVQLQRNLGEWVTDTLIHAKGLSNVQYSLTGSVPVEFSETIRFRVVLITDSHQDFWSIFSGSTVTGSFETYPGWPGYLPVELDYFIGFYFNKAIVLKWATFSETNCDYYNIERSSDSRNYDRIAFIDGAGNSNQYLKYAYVDEGKISEKTVYYKLKQVDMDGKYAYYGPIAVDNNPEKLQFALSPNPAETFSNILLSLPVELCKVNQVQVFNSIGSLVINCMVEGENFMFTLSKPGIYIVAVTNNYTVSYNKFTVK